MDAGGAALPWKIAPMQTVTIALGVQESADYKLG